MSIHKDKVPHELTRLKQWVLWKTIERDGNPTKVPFQYNGAPAKSNDADTWSNFTAATAKLDIGDWSGVGFMFSAADEFCGIDLDGCRNPETGEIANWAREIIKQLNSYAEVSPSQTGVKVFVKAKAPEDRGWKKTLTEVEEVTGDKVPGLEIYDRLRYFAVTGWRLGGLPTEPQERQAEVDAIKEKFWPPQTSTYAPPQNFYDDAAVVERARKYLAQVDGAVSGQKGHDRTFHVACVLVVDFNLEQSAARMLLGEWNAKCDPPWSDRDLDRKIAEASKQPGPRGRLRDASLQRLQSTALPERKAPAPKVEPKMTTLADAMHGYINKLEGGASPLIELGLGEVDYAVGGGVESGELVVLAARPSHGKSAIALQCVHTWTSNDRTGIIISEEMSATALGKRALQYVSDVPQEHWATSLVELKTEADHYASKHKRAIIVESCGTTDAAVEQIDLAKKEHGIQFAVVDYAQILRGVGKSRYEQVTDTSIKLKQCASRNQIIVLMLCQLSREIETRQKFVPVMSDLRESGQIEQDADVIMFLVWPHRIDSAQPAHEYKFYIAKNRNRPINQSVVRARFVPSRQMVMDERPADQVRHVKRERSFDAYNADQEF